MLNNPGLCDHKELNIIFLHCESSHGLKDHEIITDCKSLVTLSTIKWVLSSLSSHILKKANL